MKNQIPCLVSGIADAVGYRRTDGRWSMADEVRQGTGGGDEDGTQRGGKGGRRGEEMEAAA